MGTRLGASHTEMISTVGLSHGVFPAQREANQPGAREAVLLLYPALLLSPTLTLCTRTAPQAIPARATTDMARVLVFHDHPSVPLPEHVSAAKRMSMVRPGPRRSARPASRHAT